MDKLEQIPPVIIAVDPGHSTGWAQFLNGKLERVGVEKDLPQIFKWLEGLFTNVFVVEDFRVNPGRNLAWNQLIAPRVIGAVEYRAYELNATLVKQPPHIKPAAFGLSGMKYKKNSKDAHIQDAIAHGTFYLHKEYGYVAKEG